MQHEISVGIFIDGANINLLGIYFDWRQFKKWIADNRDIREANYINSTPFSQHDIRLYKHIRLSGFALWRQDPVRIKATNKLKQCGIDILLTIKAIEFQDNFDTFILVSGDSDFLPLLEYMEGRSKNIEIVSNRAQLNPIYYNHNYKIRYIEDFFKVNHIVEELHR